MNDIQQNEEINKKNSIEKIISTNNIIRKQPLNTQKILNLIRNENDSE